MYKQESGQLSIIFKNILFETFEVAYRATTNTGCPAVEEVPQRLVVFSFKLLINQMFYFSVML